MIYAHLEAEGKKLTDQQLHGKYIAPVDLRTSPGFSKLLEEAESIRKNDEEKAQQLFSPAQRKAEEVAHRLTLFDSIAQNNPLLVEALERELAAETPVWKLRHLQIGVSNLGYHGGVLGAAAVALSHLEEQGQ